MDAFSSTMTFTHLFIIWTLLGVLLVWILLFAFLALRPEKEEMVEEPATLFAPRTPVTHIPASAVSSPIHAHRNEPVSEPVPFV